MMDETGIPRLLVPFLVAAALFLCDLLVYGTAIHLILNVVVRLIRSGYGGLDFWRSTAVMVVMTAIMATAHLTQITLWAVAFLACGLVPSLEAALYLSAQSYTALGYGDILLAEGWRLLGPLEATNGLLFFGLSTAVLFAIMGQLVAHRVHNEPADYGEAAGGRAPRSIARNSH